MTAKRQHVVHGEGISDITPGTNIIEAHNLELKSPLGCPYSGIDLSVKQGEVVAIRGRSGSGKTALLLTLGGRTRFTKGDLAVLGYQLPHHMRDVQKRVGLGLIEGINDLPDTQLARMSVAAEFELYKRPLTKREVSDYLDEWGLASIADKRIRDLSEGQLVCLGIALAWVGHPAIMIVDDIETQLTKDQSAEIMNGLIGLAHSRNVTVLVGVLERSLAAMADKALYL